jgi:DMSO/TMAO reductase YedYZ molybdopterin-dependent catalytic subunit
VEPEQNDPPVTAIASIYEKSETIFKNSQDSVRLAYQINDQILPREHGFPLRVVVEGYSGYDWVKYVDQITARKV